jgi:inosine-uridine nucleoside N-ribohydrolase
MPQKLILDVDTGTDDAVALMCAALHPELDLLAATTVNGNVPVETCTDNSLRVFDHIGVPVPVYQGMHRPMVRDDFPVPRGVGRSDVHGGTLDIPPAHSRAADGHAVDFLIETFMASDGDIVLVPVGPLTNVAMALTREPRLRDAIAALVIMGGGHEVGNVTPSAEFNVWGDPEAARVVLGSGVRSVTLVPLDATHRALVSLEDCARLRALGTPAGEAAALFTERRIRGYDASQPMHRLGAAPVHDALAVATLVEPGIVSTVRCHVDVETSGELTLGRTVVDTHARSGHEPNCEVALDADEPRFVRFLLETLGRRGEDAVQSSRRRTG